MQTFRLTIAYDGTDFVGWQRQTSGTSIQGLLEDALTALDGRPVPVVGAGRTDAGVHARGQVARCTLERAIAADTLVRAVNARLPDAVRVLSASPVPARFHPRYDARSKTYRYRIWNDAVLDPFERSYVWHIAGRLDADAMAAAARVLVGCHDFAAFQAAGSPTRTTERVVFSSSVERGAAPPLVVYSICGDGFLRHMVRTIVGSLVEVGRGAQPAEWMESVLASRDRARAGPTAPAAGLLLVGVSYDSDALAAER